MTNSKENNNYSYSYDLQLILLEDVYGYTSEEYERVITKIQREIDSDKEEGRKQIQIKTLKDNAIVNAGYVVATALYGRMSPKWYQVQAIAQGDQKQDVYGFIDKMFKEYEEKISKLKTTIENNELHPSIQTIIDMGGKNFLEGESRKFYNTEKFAKTLFTMVDAIYTLALKHDTENKDLLQKKYNLILQKKDRIGLLELSEEFVGMSNHVDQVLQSGIFNKTKDIKQSLATTLLGDVVVIKQ